MSMNIITTIKITSDQKQYLEDKSINFSKFVRRRIDEAMRLCVVHDHAQKKC
jgi:hypothetical protein